MSPDLEAVVAADEEARGRLAAALEAEALAITQEADRAVRARCDPT